MTEVGWLFQIIKQLTQQREQGTDREESTCVQEVWSSEHVAGEKPGASLWRLSCPDQSDNVTIPESSPQMI